MVSNNNTKSIFILVISHPDDESMFFLPTLYNLTNKKNKSYNHYDEIHILCLSNGNYDGLGMERTKEIHRATNIISKSIQVTVLNQPQLKDGPNELWTSDSIMNAIMDFLGGDNTILQNNYNDDTDHHDPKDNVHILTFDKGGVSGHVNHIATYIGLSHFHHLIQRAKLGKQSNSTRILSSSSRIDKRIKHIAANMNIKLQVLETIYNPIDKYFPFLELIRILITTFFYTHYILPSRRRNGGSSPDTTECYFLFRPLLVWSAMKAHFTQFVWYRRLFVIFSRYSYINTIRTIGEENDESMTKKII
jgi:N-acetylglucosaminylphosphatidylinositol deacetylase